MRKSVVRRPPYDNKCVSTEGLGPALADRDRHSPGIDSRSYSLGARQVFAHTHVVRDCAKSPATLPVVVRDGKIVAQSFAGKIRPKG